MWTRYRSGQWNTVCPRCGFRFKSGDMLTEWTGQRVCSECYDPKHPMIDAGVRSARGMRSIPFAFHEAEAAAIPGEGILGPGGEGILGPDAEPILGPNP